MTQKEEQLLLKDLCARLPYGVRARFCDGVKEEIDDVWDIDMFSGAINADYIIDDIQPYLRPMSSMTKEEKNEIKVLGAELSPFDSIRFRIEEDENDGFEYGYQWLDILDFLNSHYFDYRDLIKKGLALGAPEGMYKID